MVGSDGMAEAGAITGVEIDELMGALALSVTRKAAARAEQRSDYVTAPELGGVLPLSSSSNCAAVSLYITARRRRLEQLRSECCSEEGYKIEKSREHWTEVGRVSSEEELLHVANHRHFQRLVTNWHPPPDFPNELPFFRDYGDALEVGQKITEGGQAEILAATLHGSPRVLKVFKSGSTLEELERLWTVKRLLRDPLKELLRDPLKELLRNYCVVQGGTLLKDGRFAFVVNRYGGGDLRTFIDQQTKDSNHVQGPLYNSMLGFSRTIMLHISRGMLNSHGLGILHRDLKASNVLLYGSGESIRGFRVEDFECDIADFESSSGVHGTGFWRAPEVLCALKNRDLNLEIWTEKVDVYSYAMTCYEVLTGCIPFGNLASNDYDVVIRGERPPLLDFVDGGIQELLLRRCWHSDIMEASGKFFHITCTNGLFFKRC